MARSSSNPPNQPGLIWYSLQVKRQYPFSPPNFPDPPPLDTVLEFNVCFAGTHDADARALEKNIRRLIEDKDLYDLPAKELKKIRTPLTHCVTYCIRPVKTRGETGRAKWRSGGRGCQELFDESGCHRSGR